MTRTDVPREIELLARARARARRERDWPEADRLRAELEAAGWRVVDQGYEYRISPLHPPDRVEDGRVLHGSSGSVPSRAADPETGLASVVLLATDRPNELGRSLDGLAAHAPPGVQTVIVANDPTAGHREVLSAGPSGSRRSDDATALEVVGTATRLGDAAALNAGLRRAAAGVVVVLTSSAEPTGDFVTPLATALSDPSVAVAGTPGLVSADMRRFTEAGPGDVDAIGFPCIAFRRDDYVQRGPLDERFRIASHLDVWWSLVLRDEGSDREPRRALALDLPLRSHPAESNGDRPAPDTDRQTKRNFYRVIDRFGGRRDLLLAEKRAR